MNDNETWKDIAGYEGIYQISNLGRIMSCERDVKCGPGGKGIKHLYSHLMYPATSKKTGYVEVALSFNHKMSYKLIHRLVAEAFIPNPDNLPQVNHKDGNKQNNQACNLEWVSCSDNIKHAVSSGLTRTGQLWNDSHKTNCKSVKCIETGKVYLSMYEAGRDVGMSGEYVSIGAQTGKAVKGLHFVFVGGDASEKAAMV